MNAKKAKQLRKEARKLTVGRPVVAYEKRKWLTSTPVRLMSGCTRYVYKQLKRAAKK